MSLYLNAPRSMKPTEMSAYTPVTDVNRKNAVIMGRTLYVISKNGTIITYRGFINIRPRLTKGRVKISGHPHMKDIETYVNEDENNNDYVKSFKSLIDKLIGEGSLYVNLKDPLTVYKRI